MRDEMRAIGHFRRQLWAFRRQYQRNTASMKTPRSRLWSYYLPKNDARAEQWRNVLYFIGSVRRNSSHLHATANALMAKGWRR